MLLLLDYIFLKFLYLLGIFPEIFVGKLWPRLGVDGQSADEMGLAVKLLKLGEGHMKVICYRLLLNYSLDFYM